MKAPHSLKNWLDCEDPECPCNDWLMSQPEIPSDRSFTMGLNRKGPRVIAQKRITPDARQRANERVTAWRKANPERVAQNQKRQRERRKVNG